MRFLSFFLFVTLMIEVFIGMRCHSTWAFDSQPLYRGARASAMGNAFTAVADDEQAIFFNPAGLAGVRKISFNMVSVNVEVSNDVITGLSGFSNALSNTSVTTLNTFIGKDLYARGQGTSSIVLPGFGLAAIADEQIGLHLQNEALPQGSIQEQTTYGIQMGVGLPIVKLRKKRGELRFGLAGKLLWRSGGYIVPSTTQILTANIQSLRNQLSPVGTGFGMDSGFQFVYNARKNLALQAGLAMTDIGNTSFSSGSLTQPGNLTYGLAAIYKNADVVATLAYDYSRILDNIDWRKKNHFGLELKFPILRLYGGVDQVYFTYGAGLDLALIQIMYLSYAEELATLINQNPERRSMIHFALKFEL
jgi:hypothetical protein